MEALPETRPSSQISPFSGFQSALQKTEAKLPQLSTCVSTITFFLKHFYGSGSHSLRSNTIFFLISPIVVVGKRDLRRLSDFPKIENAKSSEVTEKMARRYRTQLSFKVP
jgi:hypothetical protein